MDHYPFILTATAVFFLIQFGSGWICKNFFRSAWKELELGKSTDEWCVRNVSTAHCFVAWTLVPGWFLKPQSAVTDFYAFDPFVQTVLCISVGYFIWDLIICLWYRWPLPFLAHCICCLAVMYAGLYPFLHFQGRFFLGFYEISTPWLNVYKQMQLTGNTKGSLYTALGLLFAVTFTVARILWGIPYSVRWYFQMYELVNFGRPHSTAIVAMYVVANVILNGVNLLWWKGILDLAGRRITGSSKAME
eukprot:GGOE01008001.1.p1 GENE.GGOE01008001.1~~GGOE01008001.1.p1  ORF type:complete len:272 (-),score=42.54 GGOE01008001.1:697-1437(-)